MAQIVRQSKFRHVFCKPIKHEDCMSQITITEVSWDSQFCTVNPKFIAIIVKGSGGPFLVLPVNKVGRVDKDHPFVDAHRGPCLEIAFSPFNDNVIASCSEDATAKVWVIPERGLLRNLSEPAVELCGHQKRVNTLAWHPTANNILATAGGENKLLIWNVGTGEALLEVSGHPDQIWSIAFNYDGSQFITTCKDRVLRIFNSHTGFSRHGKYIATHTVTTGFSKRSERIYALRHPSNLSQPIMGDELDTSNAVLFPLYDEDSGLLYLVGKGDCAIRYYEVNDDPPFVHYINTYTTSEPQRAFGFMPKRGIDSVKNEINRIYKVTTKGVVDVLQFFVPRKSDLYQTDLYPDTRSTEPAMTAEEFIAGKDAQPKLIPVNPEAAQAKPKITVAKKANILQNLPNTETAPAAYQQRSSPPQQSAPVQQQKRRPQVDEDMGIQIAPVSKPSPSKQQQQQQQYYDQSPPRQNEMAQRIKASSRPQEERPGAGGGASTAGQKRAAAELERIRREQNRSAAISSEAPSSATTPSASRKGSSVTHGEINESVREELEKMKAILRQHERRIRLLEDQLADVTMQAAYNL